VQNVQGASAARGVLVQAVTATTGNAIGLVASTVIGVIGASGVQLETVGASAGPATGVQLGNVFGSNIGRGISIVGVTGGQLAQGF
jgi:hypothetical protein